MTVSFKSLTKEDHIKRVDSYRVKLDAIQIDPDFNTRVDGDRLREHIHHLTQYILTGGMLPPLEVIPKEDGTVQVVDGHCRTMAYRAARDAGAEIDWIDVRHFRGNDLDRVTRIVSSNEGLKLTPLETAMVYKRLRGYNLSPSDIAKRVQKSATYVNNLLMLADAPQQIIDWVAQERIAATTAIEVLQEYGEGAVTHLDFLLNPSSEPLEEEGAKRKITPKQARGWKPSPGIVRMLVNRLDEFAESSFDFEFNAMMANDAVPGDQQIIVTKAAVHGLWELHKLMSEERGQK